MIGPIRTIHIFLSVLIAATVLATSRAYTAEPPQSGSDIYGDVVREAPSSS